MEPGLPAAVVNKVAPPLTAGQSPPHHGAVCPATTAPGGSGSLAAAA
jgi:hypothetical protein